MGKGNKSIADLPPVVTEGRSPARTETDQMWNHMTLMSAQQNGNTVLPKHEFTKPYQTQPTRPISHRPCVLAAKLNGVPRTQTSRSLKEMLTSSRFMGVRSVRYRQNRVRTRKLLRNPRVPMKPRHNATTRWPLGVRDRGGSVTPPPPPGALAYASVGAAAVFSAPPPSPTGHCTQFRLSLHKIMPG